MGSDPASFFANMLLFCHKNRCIKKIKNYDIREGRRLANLFSFIEDLTLSILLKNLSGVFKISVLLNLYSIRKIQTITCNHPRIYLLKLRIINFPSIQIFNKGLFLFSYRNNTLLEKHIEYSI